MAKNFQEKTGKPAETFWEKFDLCQTFSLPTYLLAPSKILRSNGYFFPVRTQWKATNIFVIESS